MKKENSRKTVEEIFEPFLLPSTIIPCSSLGMAGHAQTKALREGLPEFAPKLGVIIDGRVAEGETPHNAKKSVYRMAKSTLTRMGVPEATARYWLRELKQPDGTVLFDFLFPKRKPKSASVVAARLAKTATEEGVTLADVLVAFVRAEVPLGSRQIALAAVKEYGLID